MAQQLHVAAFQGGLAAPYAENFALLSEKAQEAKAKGAHIVIAPEVFFTGTARLADEDYSSGSA